MIRATRQSAPSSVSPSITRSLIARKWPPTGSSYSWPTPPMHSITGRPERMPRMMVSSASGSCFMKRLAAGRRGTSRSGRVANIPKKSPGTRQSTSGLPRTSMPASTADGADRRARSITKVATDQSSSARRKLARSRAVSSSGTNFASASVSVTMSVLLLLLAHERQPRVLHVDPARHPPAADAGEPLAVLVLHPQHHGDHEEAEPDRDRDRDEEEREGDDQVARHPIASRSRVPRPKYSARGMKCGRRWLHSKRPERLPSAFSPS